MHLNHEVRLVPDPLQNLYKTEKIPFPHTVILFHMHTDGGNLSWHSDRISKLNCLRL